jgi:pimeloyl-ACP methyl ester carboxylesterase
MKEKQVLIKGIESNFKLAGEGKPILILHGWGGSSDSWEKVIDLLVEQNFKVFCPDLPGFGKTKAPKETWGVSDYVDWVLKFVEKQKLENFILLGHSFGGRISIKFANYYPNKISSLILCDSAGLKIKPNWKRRVVLGFIGFLKLIFGITFFQKIKKEIKDIFYFIISETDYAKANSRMKKIMKRVISEDLFRYLSGIKSETLIVWGEKDDIVPLSHAHVFNKQIQNSKLEIIEGVKHSPHLQSPEKLVAIILNFLEK